jgi:hypothetical protein
VQHCSLDRDAAPDAVPDTVELDVGERTTAVVEEALPSDRVRAGGHVRSETELTQSAYGVAREVEASAGRFPHSRPLDDLGGDVALMQGAGQPEAGNTGTDDQHTQGGYVAPVFPTRTRGRMFRFERNKLSGSYSALASARRSKLVP